MSFSDLPVTIASIRLVSEAAFLSQAAASSLITALEGSSTMGLSVPSKSRKMIFLILAPVMKTSIAADVSELRLFGGVHLQGGLDGVRHLFYIIRVHQQGVPEFAGRAREGA